MLAILATACGGDGDEPRSGAIAVSPTEGLRTTEAGGQDTFSVVLASRPLADVTIGLSTSDETEGTVSPEGLTFTPENWDAPQTVTVTGVDDDEADGDTAYRIVTAEAESDDAVYAGLDPDDVSVTNDDDETPGITVDPTEGLTTTEGGETDAFTVVLDARPAADVTIPLSSSDEGEGTVSPESLTFTSDNWNAPQEVTVTGVDDEEVDGDQAFTIVTGTAESDDGAYAMLDPEDVEVVNVDDETAGVTVTPTDGLEVNEGGASDTFTVVLNSAPSADVSISAVPDADGETEASVSPSELTFTPENWDAPQTVTVTGLDDEMADGNQVFDVVLGPATSGDGDYDGVEVPDVEVTNVDDDSAGVTVDPVADLTTNEGGATDTFTVVLNSEPTRNVTIGVSSSDESEGTASPASLVFTPENWNAPQTVTVEGADDDVADGDQPYSIVTAAAVSPDAEYDGLDPVDVSVTNVDDDSAGVTLSRTGGLTTTEGGADDTFALVLNTEPSADVIFALSSSDGSEGTVSPGSLTFTPENWDAPRTVTVTGEDDDAADGDQTYAVVIGAATSTDTDYDGIDPPDVGVTNVDDDSAGFTVTPSEGLRTTETGGTARFSVVLNSEPAANVTVMLSSTAEDEGTIDKGSLVFTSSNWDAPQEVTITGQADDIFDGDQPYRITISPAVSDDEDYDTVDPVDVRVVNEDADPGVRVSPVEGLTTTEAGGTATFEVVLNVQPTNDVRVTFASDDTSEGTVSPMEALFTPTNWASPQTLTVTGRDDDVADGNQTYSIVSSEAVSMGSDYNTLEVDDVEVTNVDDETADIRVLRDDVNTTEEGGTGSFRVVLTSQPTANVTIPLSVDDPSEVAIDKISLVFTAANWDAPQTVTMTGQDDDVADGNQTFRVITGAAMSADTGYDGIDAPDVTGFNLDDETAGFTVSPLDVVTREDGSAQPTFTVRLNSEPTADVVIDVSSSDTSEATVSPGQLTFTPANWDAPQAVTVTGEDDEVEDSDQPFTVVLPGASSADGTYDGLDPDDVTGVNVDDDTAGITVAFAGPLETTEEGGAATFTVRLNSEPTANVTVPIRSVDTTEGTVSDASLVFTSDNWNAPQPITITGVDDDVADGDQDYSVHTDPATSSDDNYDGLDAVNVPVTNIDDETPGFTVQPTSGLEVNEGGTPASDSFTIRLNSEPIANVTVALSSGDPSEGTVSPSSVTFTSSDWDAPKSVVVFSVDDDVEDGDQVFQIVTAPASSSDTNYDGRDPANVSVTNVDDDSAGVTVTPLEGLETTEDGGTAEFTIRLNSQPTADVMIGLSSSDMGEGTVSPSSLTFTSANWNARQTVIVTGADDFVADGNQPYTITTAPAMSADPNYVALTVPDVSVTNVDDETPGILVSKTSDLLTNEAGTVTDTFTVRLASQPTGAVTIPVDTSDTTEATASASLVFNGTNWNVGQTVSVTGVDDAVADGDRPFQVVLGPATSTDPNYNGLTGPSVEGTNLDDETPGITVTPVDGLVTSEAGGSADFSVVLNTQPVDTVTIELTGNEEGMLSTSTLTFDDTNWNVAQTVTVTGTDDMIDDGNQQYFIIGDPSTSADADYAALPAFSVEVINTDND